MRRPMAEVNQSPRAAGTQNHITKVREAAVAVDSYAAVCVGGGGGGGAFLLNVTVIVVCDNVHCRELLPFLYGI